MMLITNDNDLRVKSFESNFLYIGTKPYELIVLDFNTGKEDDQGGLYLWTYSRNPDPKRLDLDKNGRVKIIGIDIL